MSTSSAACGTGEVTDTDVTRYYLLGHEVSASAYNYIAAKLEEISAHDEAYDIMLDTLAPSKCYTDRLGTVRWFNYQGDIHRDDDAPAVISNSGRQEWYKNGLPHRTNGPAIVYPNGDAFWYKNGKPHRADGPALEYASGHKEYYIDGCELTKAAFKAVSAYFAKP